MSNLTHQNYKSASRVIAGLMLLQMGLGILLNFYFLKPVLQYDNSVSPESLNFILGVAMLSALLVSSINLAFGLLLPRSDIKKHFKTFVFLIVFASVGIAMCAYEYAKLSEYVSFLSSTGGSESYFEILRKTLSTARNEAHFLSIFVSSCSLVFFYLLLIRASLLPRWLSYFAMTASLLQLVAVGHTFFQASIPNILQLPLAITQLAVPLFLLFSGFQRSDEADIQTMQI